MAKKHLIHNHIINPATLKESSGYNVLCGKQFMDESFLTRDRNAVTCLLCIKQME